MASTTLIQPSPLLPQTSTLSHAGTPSTSFIDVPSSATVLPDRSPSILSTPTNIPHDLQPSMSFYQAPAQASMAVMAQQPSARPYNGEANGIVHQASTQKPQIYTAVYSGVSVYEMEVNRIAVMRRRSDSWLNATQILKVAGIEKGKRTKVLEKEILVGEHEKVQGGYGKYQGTWINYHRGVEFCRQYGVEELLRPLLEYDMGQDGVNAAGSGGHDTPTKEQAMAAQRKRLYSSGLESRPNGQSANGTFFKNISSTASNAVAAISKARMDSPGPRPGSGHRRPAVKRQSSQQHLGSQETAFPGGSQQSMHSLASESSFGANGAGDSAYGTQSAVYMSGMHDPNRSGDFQEPPRKRMRATTSSDHVQQHSSMYDTSMRDGTPTEPMDSFTNYHQSSSQEQMVVPLDPLPQPIGRAAEEKAQILMSLFLDATRTNFSSHPALLRLSGQDLDIPLDTTGHTALHWAATLARIPLLKALIARGSSIFRVNGGGETALIRACVVTNNLDYVSFPELLELLAPTIEMRDGRGRTVLHHIAVSSAVKGRSAASRYYLESLLEFVVRQGSAPSSQQNSFSSNMTASGGTRSIGLARFMSEIVNAQDKSGDTALNIAARIGNRSIIQQLLEVGADAGIPNRAGLRPLDFGVGGETEVKEQQMVKARAESPDRTVSKVVGETSQEIISSMSSLLSETQNEFTREMRTKQDLIDATHAQLRECSILLGKERARLDIVERKAKDRAKRHEKLVNLRRSAQARRRSLSRLGLIPGADVRTLPAVGSADLGMEVKGEELPRAVVTGDLNGSLLHHLDQKQFHYLATQPPAASLRTRLAAYATNNARLRKQAKQLRSCSSELGEQYRRVVSLCVGVEEGSVDQLLDSLVSAIDSEGGEVVEVGRVREFLRRIEAVEG